MLPDLSTRQPSRLLLLDRALMRLAPQLSFGLFARFLVLTILFGAELLIFSVWLDNAALASRGGIMGFAGRWGAWTVHGIVGFAAIFVTFAFLKSKDALDRISSQVKPMPVAGSLLAAHIFAMAAFGALSWALYGNHILRPSASLAVPIWLLAGSCAIASAAFALIPPALWVRLVRETGWLWAYSLLAVSSACVLGIYSQSFWIPFAHLTFDLVKAFLSLFVSGIISDPATMTLGTTKFSVEIAPECSGFEGTGLILAFGAVWLWLFRRECRFPQALILVPAGVAAVYLLNAARLTALILIGNAGAPKSQRAGSIPKPAGSRLTALRSASRWPPGAWLG